MSHDLEIPRPHAQSGPQKDSLNVGDVYDIREVVREGAYVAVRSAVHKSSGAQVAIKKIAPFDRPFLWLRALREIRVLRHLNNHENIVSILDVYRPTTYEDFGEIYIIQELMETNMHRVIKTQALSDDHCQYFIYQILRALKTIHSAGILHRDLKPSSLLLNQNCDLKVCSLGIARSAASIKNDQEPMIEYVTHPWYRAPELMLTPTKYTEAIDLWSVGCILAEMLGGKALFPGKTFWDQLTLIFNVLGTPNREDYNNVGSSDARAYIRSLSFKKKTPWKEVFPNDSDLALDMLEKLLAFNPIKRMSVEEALKHPYLKLYHDPADEPIAPPIPRDLLDFEKKASKLNSEELKRLMYEEILR